MVSSEEIAPDLMKPSSGNMATVKMRGEIHFVNKKKKLNKLEWQMTASSVNR